MMTRIASIFLLLLTAGMGCKNEKVVLRMATTTSVNDSGIMEYLLAKYRLERNVEVEIISGGSGKALKLAENGDVDCVLTHSPAAEDALIAKGVSKGKSRLMFNYFLIAGPKEDPAGLASVKEIKEAFAKIHSGKHGFVSRADKSGTHVKELEIWKSLNIQPQGAAWYYESGAGMGATLEIAFQKKMYTLTDQGTLLAYANSKNLATYAENDPAMLNVYSYMTVTGRQRESEAAALGAWLASPVGQESIGDFKKGSALKPFNPIGLLKN